MDQVDVETYSQVIFKNLNATLLLPLFLVNSCLDVDGTILHYFCLQDLLLWGTVFIDVNNLFGMDAPLANKGNKSIFNIYRIFIQKDSACHSFFLGLNQCNSLQFNFFCKKTDEEQCSGIIHNSTYNYIPRTLHLYCLTNIQVPTKACIIVGS